MYAHIDYTLPTADEKNRRQIARFIVFLSKKMSKHVDDDILTSAHDYYGEGADVEKMTVVLCDILNNTDMSTLHDLADTSIMARKILAWWNDRQNIDRESVSAEIKSITDRKLRYAAMMKLTDSQKKILGI